MPRWSSYKDAGLQEMKQGITQAIKTEQQALATLGDSVDRSEFQTNLEKYQRALRTGKQVPSLTP